MQQINNFVTHFARLITTRFARLITNVNFFNR